MHELFRVGEPLPVPPGQSPFCVRGIYYDRMLAYARKQFGTSALLDAIDDPRVRDFARQRFAWTGWYDVLPVMPILSTLTNLQRLEFEEGVREHTRRAAVDVIPTAFRPVLKLPGQAALAAQTAFIVASTMNFVELRLEKSTETHSSGWGRGVPLFVAPHTANTVVGFFHAVIEMRGGKDVRARYTEVVKEGKRDGFERVAIRYEFDWKRRTG